MLAGAKKEGMWGFFKGAGKGMAGLLTRPVGGILDFTSATLKTVQKYVCMYICIHTHTSICTHTHKCICTHIHLLTHRKIRVGDSEVIQIRATRYIGPDKVFESFLSPSLPPFLHSSIPPPLPPSLPPSLSP